MSQESLEEFPPLSHPVPRRSPSPLDHEAEWNRAFDMHEAGNTAAALEICGWLALHKRAEHSLRARANLFIATYASPATHPIEQHTDRCLDLLRRLRAAGKPDEWLEASAATRMAELRKDKMKQMKKKDRKHELKRMGTCHDFVDIREEGLKTECEELMKIREAAEAKAKREKK